MFDRCRQCCGTRDVETKVFGSDGGFRGGLVGGRKGREGGEEARVDGGYDGEEGNGGRGWRRVGEGGWKEGRQEAGPDCGGVEGKDEFDC